MVHLPFRDRDDAARQLATALSAFRGSKPVILAIPRGAVAMGRLLADALDGELDVVLVRKLGAPGDPEFAIGAVDELGRVILNETASWAGADEAYARSEARRQLALIQDRSGRYRHGRAALELAGRTVIVVDDGLATGATMAAALQAVRTQGPARLVCAVPVAARDSLEHVARFADQVVCLATPSPFGAVGQFYRDFSSVEDDEVVALLAAAAAAPAPASTSPTASTSTSVSNGNGEVCLRIDQVELPGELRVPASATGLVIFAHGSGSSRHSPRNRLVAQVLSRRGFATLLFDLLTAEEDQDPATRFDIPLLARRLDAALGWARVLPRLQGIPIGLFGASTGAAAALVVAAGQAGEVAAVVSRGGRPELAGAQPLSLVRSHVLLIVGSADLQVLQLNREAAAHMHDWAELVLVSGATHLFEEPGTLDRVAELAANWFARWL